MIRAAGGSVCIIKSPRTEMVVGISLRRMDASKFFPLDGIVIYFSSTHCDGIWWGLINSL